ncbi:MAG TPA: GGDEF domain-containing protein [Actinocrinis sp.]|uniref:GGDEF domain-containing protein n=1 Tax=Actinocrinis sp. TaxID=1920516 RepID=UPI002DDD6D54|nr:GGDEF domain-containing protein [Actinocrinis sp.]HEV2343068.1 GGDEF domain-containing protein [Actinocrinis sp.]
MAPGSSTGPEHERSGFDVVDKGTDGHIPLSALRPVHRAISGVNGAVGIDATMQAIADGVVACTPFQIIAVNYVQDDGDLRCCAVAGPDELRAALLGGTCARKTIEDLLKVGEAWSDNLRFIRELSSDEPPEGIHLFVPDIDARPEDADAWQPDYALLAPMRDNGGELIGLLSVDDPSDGRIPPRWVGDVLDMFAEQAGFAILNARRHEEAAARMARLERERELLREDIAERHRREEHLRHQARHDALTGLANPVELSERLVALLADQIPLAVVFCDLDRFKEVNDNRGHVVGDLVLRMVAERLRASVRGEDVVARVGGDEFVVVAAGIGPDEALALVDRIDQAFSHPLAVTGARLLVRASLGLAYEPARQQNVFAPEERAQELLGSADREMYARKRSRAMLTRLTARALARRAPVAG